jgi:polyhydroxyalkanoate synthesis regulator phasin
MSEWKAQLRAAVGEELGIKMDDALEAARAEMCRVDGARQAFTQLADKIEQLNKVVDKEVEEGKIASLEEASTIKKWIARSVGIPKNLGLGAEVQFHVCRGKVEALEQQIKILKAFVDGERARAKELAEAKPNLPAPIQPADVVSIRRVPGTRPEDPFAARRAETAATRSESGEPTSQQEPPVPKPPPAPTAPSKEKSRKSRSRK